MTDCPLQLNDDGLWQCPDCDWIYPRKAEKPPRRTCRNVPDIIEAAEKLGITGDDIKHWAQALARWTAAGFPVRSQAEVIEIEATHCRPCEKYVDGRCQECGCRVSKSRWGVANKLKMATENCPLGKWGSSSEPRPENVLPPERSESQSKRSTRA